MKGYKALSMEMKAVNGNGMQYEMGRLYSVEGDVIPCKNGFHYCDSIEELDRYYNIAASRIFEIEADGEIIKCDGKYAAEKIKLIRELAKEEIYDYFKSNQKKFIKSGDWQVRKAVASQGYGLDILVNDKNSAVRYEVAKQGYGLDILVCDEDWHVRMEVAEQGYGLEILINDEAWQVRVAVAKQGYGLDKLIHDEDEFVRYTVRKELECNK